MKRYTSPWKARFTDNLLHKAALAGRHGLGNENGGSIAFIVVDEIWRDAVLCRLDECEWLQADRKKTDWYLQLQLSGGDLNATDKRGLPIDRNQEFEDFCDFVDECENFALENYEGNPDLGFAETVYLSFHKAIGVSLMKIIRLQCLTKRNTMPNASAIIAIRIDGLTSLFLRTTKMVQSQL